METSDLNSPGIRIDPESMDWEKTAGLIPAIVQHSDTGRVLMLGFMNRDALNRTLKTGLVTFWSRSRNELWTKGETSGHYLRLVQALPDCDHDTILLLAKPQGPTCHLGRTSCFGDNRPAFGLEMLGQLEAVIQFRKDSLPSNSYTTRLFQAGIHEISKKLGEEAIEVILSTAQGEKRTVEEAADLVYHLLVYLAAREVPLESVMQKLTERHFGR